MFCARSRKVQRQDHAASLVGTAATVADQVRERVVPAVGQAAGTAREWGQPRVKAARVWAKPHIDHSIEVAAPRLESAVSGIAPKVDIARDKIVEELLPRVNEAITTWAAASAAARDEVVTRGQGAAAVITGDAIALPKHRKRGRVLMILGLLSAAAAGAMAFMKRSAPKDDPWATPIADPYVAPPNGRTPKVAPADDTAKAGDSKPTVVDDLSEAEPLNPSADPELAEQERRDEGSPS